MVFTSAVHGGWSRRAILSAAGSVGVLVSLPGCSLLSREPDPPPPPDPLEPLLAATRELIARYRDALATLPEHPERAAALAPLQQAHLAHAEALLAVIGRPSGPVTGPPSGPPSGPPADREAGRPPSPAPDGVDPDQLLEELREAERQAQAQAAEACLTATPDRTALLGSITAARATHVEVLV